MCLLLLVVLILLLRCILDSVNSLFTGLSELCFCGVL
jgi:hypothetical protein